MTIDYQSHPSDLVGSGDVNHVGIRDLRNAIPPHCFKPSYLRSLFYLLRDVTMAAVVGWAAYEWIPMLEYPGLRYLAWAGYGYLQGLIWTGLWVLGHECGHGGFSQSHLLNTVVGATLHSCLLTPYFAWRSSHRRHHIYANNMDKDHNYVPPRRHQYITSLFQTIQKMDELTEDSPVFTLLRIILQQLLGFPWYLLTNITASNGSLHRKRSSMPLGNSHFLPSSTLFRPDEAKYIFASDLGLVAMMTGLLYASKWIGFKSVLLLYFQPYMWVNHWIVAITYLHHTHPSLPKFEDSAWSFIKGATATIDRSYGWSGRFFFHDIIDYHVIHHLFPSMPFYHGEEATKAIIPLLGKAYHEDKQRSFFEGIWESFTKCQWVEPDPSDASDNQVLWYHAGPSPPVETSMGVKGFGM